MATNEHPRINGLSPEDRAALKRLARAAGRIGYRAKGILLLADGLSKAAVSRKLRVGQGAVRQWERRWIAGGGADSLKMRVGKRAPRRVDTPATPALPARIPTEELALLRSGPSGRGRPVSARTSIEAWVRDIAALGLAAPGARLPNQTWFVKRFHAAPHTVAAAFAALARQGFVLNRRRIGSYLADPLPFDRRYLMVVAHNNEGWDQAFEAAARKQEERLGVRWDIRRMSSYDVTGLTALHADIAAQRWAGVFLRMSPSEDLPGWEFLHLGRTPISGILYDLPSNGRRTVPLARDSGFDDRWNCATDCLFATLKGAGRHRPLVIATVREHSSGGQEEAVRRKAAEYGLDIPEACYQLLAIRQKEQIGTILAAAVRVAELENIDSVAVLQDNFAVPVCEALARRFGADCAARLSIVAWGNRPSIPKTCLPVTWHGNDMGATLDSFVDWCDAIHAGTKDPPPPVLATF